MDLAAFTDGVVGFWLREPMLVGLAFGLVHALDADHVAAIGGLAVSDRSMSPTAYALRWALGHAAALGLIAAFVLGLGVVGLMTVSGYAEIVVAATLIAVGLHALRGVAGRGAAAETHVGTLRLGGRAGVLMGMLHGGAGSAAVIALLPIATFDTGLDSGLYLACFSLGVAAGACAFARMLAGAIACTERASAKLHTALHALVGIVAVVTGVLLFTEIVGGG